MVAVDLLKAAVRTAVLRKEAAEEPVTRKEAVAEGGAAVPEEADENGAGAVG